MRNVRRVPTRGNYDELKEHQTARYRREFERKGPFLWALRNCHEICWMVIRVKRAESYGEYVEKIQGTPALRF